MVFGGCFVKIAHARRNFLDSTNHALIFELIGGEVVKEVDHVCRACDATPGIFEDNSVFPFIVGDCAGSTTAEYRYMLALVAIETEWASLCKTPTPETAARLLALAEVLPTDMSIPAECKSMHAVSINVPEYVKAAKQVVTLAGYKVASVQPGDLHAHKHCFINVEKATALAADEHLTQCVAELEKGFSTDALGRALAWLEVLGTKHRISDHVVKIISLNRNAAMRTGTHVVTDPGVRALVASWSALQ